MKTAAELWADTIKKQPIDDLTIALTLSGLMALLLPKERLFVIHHLGADISEAVAGGTVEELKRTRCVEVCGNNIVERIAVDVDDWPDTPAPILLVTIGGKVKTHE